MGRKDVRSSSAEQSAGHVQRSRGTTMINDDASTCTDCGIRRGRCVRPRGYLRSALEGVVSAMCQVEKKGEN